MQETIENASKLLKNYRGKLTKQERIKNMVYIISFFIMLFLVVIAGVYERIGIAIFLTLLYLFAVFATSYTFKKRASPLMRYSNFLLAVFCRAENNRLYLKKRLEVRPGYLGKWLEISVVDTGVDEEASVAQAHRDIVDNMRQRFLRSSLEGRSSQTVQGANMSQQQLLQN